MSKPRKLSSGKWQAYLNVTEAGQRKQISLGTFHTQRDAKDAISVAEAKRKAGTFTKLSDGKTPVRVWVETWYANRLKPDRKIRSFLDARIIPRWGDWPLADLSPLGLRGWIRDLADEGALNPSTIRDIYDTLRIALDGAVEERLIPVNPCRLKSSDFPKLIETETVFLTREQGVLIEAHAPARYRAMMHLALWTGMRWGELAALAWEQVDLEAGVVTVSRALKTDRSIGLPKNGKARKLLISPATVAVLREHRRDFGVSDLVFTTSRGARRLSDANFRTHIWHPLMDTLGFSPRPTFHDLRHTHCGWMIAQGMDWMVLSDRMGHHKPSFTMDRYGHLRHDSAAVTLAALEAAMR